MAQEFDCATEVARYLPEAEPCTFIEALAAVGFSSIIFQDPKGENDFCLAWRHAKFSRAASTTALLENLVVRPVALDEQSNHTHTQFALGIDDGPTEPSVVALDLQEQWHPRREDGRYSAAPELVDLSKRWLHSSGAA